MTSKKMRAIFRFDAFAEDGHRPLMPFEKRRQERCDKGFFNDLRQRLGREQWNELGDEIVGLIRLDDHGQLHGRSFHFNRGTGVGDTWRHQ